MRTVEELKQEQYELKARLHEIVELVNSEKFYTLSVEERGVINQQRVGMELYLSSLTKRIYGQDNVSDTDNLIWFSVLYGLFNTTGSFNTLNYKEKDDEK